MGVRYRRIAAALLTLALVAAAGAAWFALRPAPEGPATADPYGLESMIGQVRPDFRLPDRSGRLRAASEWDGDIVVVNFWATWCVPCRKEIPLLADLHARHDGLTVVGIALDEAEAVEAFLAALDTDVDYPVLVAPDAAGIDTAIAWGNAFGGLPYTVIVAPDRRIAFAQFGELTPDQATRALAPLLP